MGTEIFPMIERKNLSTGYWINSGDPMIGKNYFLYSILGNVRNDKQLPFIAENRGLSNNSCMEFRAYQQCFRGVATSWVTLQEMKDYDYLLTPIHPELWLDLIQNLEDVRLKFGLNNNDVRLVFFFDYT